MPYNLEEKKDNLIMGHINETGTLKLDGGHHLLEYFYSARGSVVPHCGDKKFVTGIDKALLLFPER